MNHHMGFIMFSKFLESCPKFRHRNMNGVLKAGEVTFGRGSTVDDHDGFTGIDSAVQLGRFDFHGHVFTHSLLHPDLFGGCRPWGAPVHSEQMA